MKKIDLHIHTIPTISDSQFEFSLDTFKKYAEEAHLDAVAITNHDVFRPGWIRRAGYSVTMAKCSFSSGLM